MTLQEQVSPKEITIDPDNNNVEIASFGYYDGSFYVKEAKLKQTGSFEEVIAGTHFMVCCGDIMVKVEPTDYPKITRRII